MLNLNSNIGRRQFLSMAGVMTASLTLPSLVIPGLVSAARAPRLKNVNGNIYVPAGKHIINEGSFHLSPKATLFGEGEEISELHFADPTSDGVVLPKTGLGWGIENLKITSARQTHDGIAVKGLNSSYGKIKNVKIEGHWYEGLHFHNCIGNKIDRLQIGGWGNSRVKDKYRGIHLSGVSHFNKFDTCVVRNPLSHCVLISQGDANTFMHCEVGYTGKAPYAYGYVMQSNAHRNKVVYSWAEDLEVGWVCDPGALTNVFMYVLTPGCVIPYIDNGYGTRKFLY